MKIEKVTFYGEVLPKVILSKEDLDVIQKMTDMMDAITSFTLSLIESGDRNSIYSYGCEAPFIIESEDKHIVFNEENPFRQFENATIEFSHDSDYCGSIEAYTEEEFDEYCRAHKGWVGRR